MKIYPINFTPNRYHQKSKNAAPKLFKNGISDKVTFGAKKPLECPTTPQTTIDWAQNWDKDKRKTELNLKTQNVSKMEKAARLAEAFCIPDGGNIDDLIAGYDAEKQIIRSLFTDQIAAEKAGLKADIPNSILLYGPIGTGKTTFIRAVAHETDCELVEMNPDPDNFSKEVLEKLKEARERYLNEGKRTIIVLNEIEDYLEDTKINHENISMMKSWLSNCAKLPTNNLQNAYATTFFFATNHPLEITDEILPREEKIKKIISLEPAAEGNIEAIIRFYIQKFDKNREMIDPDSIDYNAIIEKMNPDDEKGAFGNDKIKKIVQLACQDFDNDIDNKKPFEEYLNNRIDKAKRNIKPKRLQEFKEQLEELY